MKSGLLEVAIFPSQFNFSLQCYGRVFGIYFKSSNWADADLEFVTGVTGIPV